MFWEKRSCDFGSRVRLWDKASLESETTDTVWEKQPRAYRRAADAYFSVLGCAAPLLRQPGSN